MTIETPTARRSLAEAAGSIAALVAAGSAEAESSRRISLEVAEALTDSGFARHFVPVRWGGTAGSYSDFATAVVRLGQSCAAAAWCAAVYAILGRMAAHLPEEGQEEIWGAGPDQRIACSLTPAGQAVPVAGGVRLTGRWTFASGIDTAHWALISAVPPGSAPAYFAVPRAQIRIVRSWDSIGLRGTGSHTIELDGAVVPARRSTPVSRVWNGVVDGDAAHCHRVPLKAVNGLAFVAPALGSARSALTAWTSWIAGKRESTGGAARDRATVQIALARSSGEMDAAWLLLERAARAADRRDLSPRAVATNARDFALAAELLVAAVNQLYRAGGAQAQSETNPIQRSWRDVHGAAGHFALQFEANAAAYAVHHFEDPSGEDVR